MIDASCSIHMPTQIFDWEHYRAKFARSGIRALKRNANLTPRGFQITWIASNFFISCRQIYLNYVNSDNLKQNIEENNWKMVSFSSNMTPLMLESVFWNFCMRHATYDFIRSKPDILLNDWDKSVLQKPFEVSRWRNTL